MITPGANRPPPIGSDVVTTGFDGGRERDEAGCGVRTRATGGSGAMVRRLASSKPVSPKTVAFGSSTACPHLAQKCAVGATLLPQNVQNMGEGFYHPLVTGRMFLLN